MKPISKDSDVYAIKEFIEMCQSGFFIDYDGFGLYATETEVTEFPSGIVKPSDIMKNNINLNYSHIVWFNK